MPFVVVAVPCQGASVRQFQIALRPFQGLDRRLLIDTENNRVFGRRHIKTDHIGGLCRKIRIVALAPAFAPGQINLLFTQRPPNVLHIDVAQRPRDQWPVPARKPLGRRLVENFANALVGHLAIDRWGAGPQPNLQPVETFARVADAPQAHRGRGRLQLAGDLPRPVPFRRFQHDPYPQQLPLFRGRRTQSRLQNTAISRPQPHFHGIRYHAILNHGAKHRDSAIMTHSLQIVGTLAFNQRIRRDCSCRAICSGRNGQLSDGFRPHRSNGTTTAATTTFSASPGR